MSSSTNDKVFTSGVVSYLLGLTAVIGIGVVVFLLASETTLDTETAGFADVCVSVLDSGGHETGSAETCEPMRQQHLGQALLLAIPSLLLGAASISLAVRPRR